MSRMKCAIVSESKPPVMCAMHCMLTIILICILFLMIGSLVFYIFKQYFSYVIGGKKVGKEYKCPN